LSLSQNDPFRSDTPAQIAEGKWFTEIWERFGLGQGVHLRRIHYLLVSTAGVLNVYGKPYENTTRQWDMLVVASATARFLDFVPGDAFVDRRNPEPLWIEPEEVEASIDVVAADDWQWQTPEFPELPTLALQAPTPFRPIDIWIVCEKSTINDILAAAARALWRRHHHRCW
jgi:hypothetical protein